MKDSLKEFIDNHRDEFDDRIPNEKVWSEIQSELRRGRIVSLWNNLVVWRVAAVLLLGLSAFLFMSQNGLRAGKEQTQMQSEFASLEKFYSQQIDDKIELIDNIQDFDQDESFTQDMQKLDAMYQVLREQMKSNPSDKIKDALILNMLVRIDLLNQQLAAIESSNKKSENITI